MKRSLALATAFVALGGTAFAGDKESVQTFYDLLSDPSSKELQAAFVEATSPDWESVGDYSGENEGRDGFLGQMGFFAKLMPDLKWDVQAMYQDGNFITVRSRATATPTGPLFGVDGEGRSFDILTIDVHELEDGKIVRTYHVEDWAGALQQLSGR